MAWGSNTISATDLALLAADKLLLLGDNAIRGADAVIWDTDDPPSGGDEADSDGPSALGYDDSQAGRTYPDAAQIVWHYAVTATTNPMDFDSIVLLNHNLGTLATAAGGETVTLSFEVSDNADFTSETEIHSEVIPAGDNRRIVILDLDGKSSNDQLLDTVVNFRMIVTHSGAATGIPKFGELILSQRRQMKHNPKDGYDPLALRSDAPVFESSTGVQTAYVRHKGRQVVDAILNPHETTYINRIKSFYDADTEFGTRPFVWVPQGTTDPQDAPYMRLTPPHLNGPGNGPFERVFRLTATELGPTFNAAEF